MRLLAAYRIRSTTFLRGEWEQVLQFANDFIAECEADAPHVLESDIRALRATIRLARDDDSGALADCTAAVAHVRNAATADAAPRALASLAAIYRELGRAEEAQTLANEVFAYDLSFDLAAIAWIGHRLAWDADAFGVRPNIAVMLARLPPTNPWRICTQAILNSEFGRAAGHFASIGASVLEARARLRQAETLAHQTRHSEAREQLGKALTFFRSIGATRYIRKTEAVLAAADPATAPEQARV
jgi:tetratricopeptide (TPR) repeat protein